MTIIKNRQNYGTNAPIGISEDNSMKLINSDCMQVMKDIPDHSIDMILCDLPYGTSASKWDYIIPLDDLWDEYERIIKPNRAIVLFAQQPFTSQLIQSNLKWWKYNWIWQKDNGTNFLNSHYCPLKITEDICVFGTGAAAPTKNNNSLIYNPQFSVGKPYSCISGKQAIDSAVTRHNSLNVDGHKTVSNGTRYPNNILTFKRDKDKFHPTQKPVALLEYLIKTYSNKGDLILDNCVGSGSTMVAALKTGRRCIGIELKIEYCNIAIERLNKVS